jgi:hypothetical protein
MVSRYSLGGVRHEVIETATGLAEELRIAGRLVDPEGALHGLEVGRLLVMLAKGRPRRVGTPRIQQAPGGVKDQRAPRIIGVGPDLPGRLEEPDGGPVLARLEAEQRLLGERPAAVVRFPPVRRGRPTPSPPPPGLPPDLRDGRGSGPPAPRGSAHQGTPGRASPLRLSRWLRTPTRTLGQSPGSAGDTVRAPSLRERGAERNPAPLISKRAPLRIKERSSPGGGPGQLACRFPDTEIRGTGLSAARRRSSAREKGRLATSDVQRVVAERADEGEQEAQAHVRPRLGDELAGVDRQVRAQLREGGGPAGEAAEDSGPAVARLEVPPDVARRGRCGAREAAPARPLRPQ